MLSVLLTNDNIEIDYETGLTYLEPRPPGVYHPFASRYFAKLPGLPAHTVKKFPTELVAMRDDGNGRSSLPTEYCWWYLGGLGQSRFKTDHEPAGGVRGPGGKCGFRSVQMQKSDRY